MTREAPLCDLGSVHDTLPQFSHLLLTLGGQLTRKDLASFQVEVVDALAMPLGDYTLYSPPPPAGGALLSFVLNVLKGEVPKSPGLQPRVQLGSRELNSTPSQALGRHFFLHLSPLLRR